jgi:hypothetical protein
VVPFLDDDILKPDPPIFVLAEGKVLAGFC